MKRLVLLAMLVACNKPTEDNCRKALANMQHLLGTEDANDTVRVESGVRACRSGSTKEAVDCAIKATSVDELRKCGFSDIPAGKK